MTVPQPLPHTPQAWDAESLWQRLEPLLPGLTVEVLAKTDSTNTALLDRIRQGDTAPCLLVAESQTQGRGRLGRQWQSEPGASLTFSLSLPIRATDWSGLSLAVGLALAEALDPPVPSRQPRIGLKWPNDLMLCGADGAWRKLGGILIESLPAASQRIAVIGIGLNVAPAGPDTPVAGWSQGRADLQSLDPALNAPAALHRIALPLLATLQRFQQAGFAPLRSRFAARDTLSGCPVTTTSAEAPQGLADGIDDDGALVLRHEGRRIRLTSGEVSVRARQPAAPQESAC